MHHPCCIIALNYNGILHLEECLASVVVAAQRPGVTCKVVLVDNCSTDGSIEFVRERFPSVESVIAPTNDFLFSLNDVVRQRPEEIVVVVNNDMRFAPDFVEPLVRHFEQPDVFAVGAAIFNWDGSRVTVGPRVAVLRRFWFYKWWDFERQEPALSLEACAGAVAYRRSMFMELGGFDELYRPGYYEDLDLSWRACRNGWKVLYEPRSIVFHKESASMLSRYGAVGKARLLYRNHVLFTAKNVGSWRFLLGFLSLLPFRAIRPLLSGYSVPLFGLIAAVPRLPLAVWRRFRLPGSWRELDRLLRELQAQARQHEWHAGSAAE